MSRLSVASAAIFAAAFFASFSSVGCSKGDALDAPENKLAFPAPDHANAPTTLPANAPAQPPAVAPPPPGAAAPLLVEGRVQQDKRSDRDRAVDEAKKSVDITVYGASWCPSCKQTRAWLDAQGMAYNERDIDRSSEANRALHRLNPAGSIPVVDIEGEVVVGFAPAQFDRAIRRRAERRVQN